MRYLEREEGNDKEKEREIMKSERGTKGETQKDRSGVANERERTR
jgi:hypothetical protein